MGAIKVFLKEVLLPIALAFCLASFLKPIYMPDGVCDYFLMWICVGLPYSKDLSVKTTSAKIQMMKQGKYVGGYAPYGYVLHPTIFKTFCAVLIVTNTWNIVMAVFDVAQSVVNQSAGVIISDAGIDISGVVGDLETTLADWSIGSLLGLWFQSVFVGLCSHILTIAIFLVIYGRMIEVYLTVSVGPIPFATMVNREWGHTGQNYLKSLLALGFQAFLIMVCVGIYAVLVQNIAVGDDITVAIWECMGYTVLLCYTLFKTGSLAKSLFGAH